MLLETEIYYIKKAVFFVTAIICCFISCSDDDSENKNKPPVDTTLKLIADKKIIEPFERLKVSVDLDLDLIYQTYDSISWKANGVFWDGIITIGGVPDDERNSYFVDYELGEHEIIILGYKKGVLLSSDTVNYTVKSPTGDFMNIKWGVEKGSTSSKYWGNYASAQVIEKDGQYVKQWIDFSLFRNYTSNYPEEEYAIMNFMPWTHSSNIPFRSLAKNISDLPHVNDFDWYDESNEGIVERGNFEYAFLYNYMTGFYGTPTLDYKGEIPSKTNLRGEYSKRVSADVAQYAWENPVAIWDTATSHIVLTQAENYMGGKRSRSSCTVIAVPRKRL